MKSVFWWLNPVRLYFLYKILYPKKRIESYSILGTIVSPNKILLKCLGVFGGLRIVEFRAKGFGSIAFQGLGFRVSTLNPKS